MNSKTKTTIGLIGSLLVFLSGIYQLAFVPPSEEFNIIPMLLTVIGLIGMIANLAKLKNLTE